MEVGEKRFAVCDWTIREGVVTYSPSFGFGVDWGHGPSYDYKGLTKAEAEAALAGKKARLDQRKHTGTEKWGQRQGSAFVVVHGKVHEVRLGMGGDLKFKNGAVAADACGVWPVLFETQQEAETEAGMKRYTCKHKWNWLSHEEAKCSKCGEYMFIPDR